MSVPRSPSGRRLAVLAVLAALSFLVTVMVAIRMSATGSPGYGNLIWNLFLAWIPLLLAFAVYDGARRGMRGLWLLGLGTLWLLFLPNAPYLMTDLKYLQEFHAAPKWFDVIMAGTAAFTGVALGSISLVLVHSVARRHFGAVWAWIGVWAVLGLSSVGVFLGRVQRFNSWDVLTDPKPILQDLAKGITNPHDYPMLVAATLVFSGFLLGAYVVFYALARYSRLLDDEPRSA
jgi:uncharacterized membrane protein